MTDKDDSFDPQYTDVFGVSNRIDDTVRTNLLENQWDNAHKFSFPSRCQGGKFRKLQAHYFTTYSWLRYSKSTDGVFCASCYLFAPRDDKNKNLIAQPLTDWSNVNKILKNHSKSETHTSSAEAAENFLSVMHGTEKDIACSMSSSYNRLVEKNRKILVGIVDTVILLGKQGLAFRGSDDEKSNFISLLQYQAKYNPIMNDHLKNGDPRTMYTSPEIQNELIEICGTFLQKEIVKKCNQAFCFGFMADEATDAATIEQMALCLRFFDEESNSIREDFLCFAECDSTTGEALSRAFLQHLREKGIAINRMRGQGYDGAANMSGRLRGVQARIQQVVPEAAYTHCKAHCLNLAKVHASKEPFIRMMMDKVQEIAFAFNYSGKRLLRFHESLANDPVSRQEMERPTKLQSLCETRWAARADALHTFLSAFRTLDSALQQLFTEGDSKAGCHRNAILRFDFIVTLVTAEHILSSCVPLSQLLQRKSCDLNEAVTEARVLNKLISDERNDPLVWDALFRKAVDLAADVGIEPSYPRNVHGRAQHRPNAPADTVSDLWRVNMYLPFADHLCGELHTRLLQEGERFKVQHLIPKQASSLTDQVIHEIHAACASDLTEDIDQFCSEVRRSKTRCQILVNPTDCLQTALSQTNRELYPNVHACLSLLLAMPVSTASAERSFSTMWRLKTYLRSTMTTQRLSGLGLLNIYRERQIDAEAVVDVFARRKERRLALIFNV